MFDLFAYLVDLRHSPLGGTTIPDQLGAGFLPMGVECALTPARRSAILTGIANRTGLEPARISLLPIPYHRGSVQVIALDAMSAPATPPAPESPEASDQFTEQIAALIDRTNTGTAQAPSEAPATEVAAEPTTEGES